MYNFITLYKLEEKAFKSSEREECCKNSCKFTFPCHLEAVSRRVFSFKKR